MERSILGAMLSKRVAYEELRHLLTNKDLSEEGNLIYDQLSKYYERDGDAGTVDKGVFLKQVERAHPKHNKHLAAIIQELSTAQSIPNVVEAFYEMKLQRVQLELSSALINNDKHRIQELMDRYQQLSGQEDVDLDENQETLVACDVDAAELVSAFSKDNLIKIYPRSLNEKVDGGLIRGHHMLVFARPEVGKSMFSINLSCGFLSQGLRVLYLINEDPAKSIYLRHISRLAMLNKFQVLESIKDAHGKALGAGMRSLVVKGISPGTVAEVDSLVVRYNPDVVIVDQLRNLRARGAAEGGLVHALEANAIGMRNIAKRRQVLAVSVTQAGDSASNKLVLDMSDVDSSKTGVPAAVDLMIGIGANPDFLLRQQRMLSICKNKASGDHSYFAVQVDEALSKVSSL